MQNLKNLTFCVLFSRRFFTIWLNFKAHSINFNIYIVTSIAQDGQAEYRRVRLLPVRMRAGGAALGAAAAAARDGRGAGAGGGLAARRTRQQHAGWSRAAQCATLPH